MAGSSIIDFATYRQFHAAKRTGAEALEEFALTTCEEAFLHRDCQRFAYWHRVYCHIRKPVKAGSGPSLMHLVVVGGSDAGNSAALRAQELKPSIEITVILADAYPNYSVCGLPFYLSGETPAWRQLRPRLCVRSKQCCCICHRGHKFHFIRLVTGRGHFEESGNQAFIPRRRRMAQSRYRNRCARMSSGRCGTRRNSGTGR